MRGRWREEDDYRTSRSDLIPSRDRRPRSPASARRAPSTEWEGNAAGRESSGRFMPGQSHHHHSQDRTKDKHRSGTHSSSVSPHRPLRQEAAYARSRDTGEGRSSYRAKHRADLSPPNKRRRSRSISPSASHPKKHHRTLSRSPHGSESPMNGVPGRNADYRNRSQSPKRSPNRHSRSRKWDHPPPSDRRTPDEPLPSSSHRRRSRSPFSRSGQAAGYRAHSPSDRRPTPSAKRDHSPRRFSPPERYPSNRHTSPRPSDRDRDRRSKYPSESSRKSPRTSRHSPSSPRSRPLANDSAPRSRRESPSASRGHRGSNHSRRTSPVPYSRPGTSKEIRHPARSSRPSSPLASHSAPHHTGDTIDESMQDSNSHPPSDAGMYQNHDRPPPSPPRPIPSFTDSDDRDDLDGDARMREAFPMHGMKVSNVPSNHRQPPRPHVDTHQPYSHSSQYSTPGSSHHHSPQSASSFGSNRAWGNHSSQYHGYAS